MWRGGIKFDDALHIQISGILTTVAESKPETVTLGGTYQKSGPNIARF